MKKKILTVVGTRPEIIRLSSIINKLDKSFDHILVNTNQNFTSSLNKVFFENFKLKKPKYSLKNKSKNSLEFIGKMLNYIDRIIIEESPDGFLILGDTHSCLSSYVAKKHKIPIFHIEAGNRSYDPRVPEEINRKLIDHLSDINLCYSENARQNLINEGLTYENVFVVGSPLKEVYDKAYHLIENSKIKKKLNIKNGNYSIVSIHRDENVQDIENLKDIFKFINHISKKYNLKSIISLHPKTKDKILKNFRSIISLDNLTFHDPFDFIDYSSLQKSSKFVISDSGSISEESYIQNFAAINIRDSHERSEAMDNGTVIMSGFNSDGLKNAINILEQQKFFGPKSRNVKIQCYDEINVSDKIINILSSYINYVKKRKWYN